MPKFGEVHFGEEYFGDGKKRGLDFKRTYMGVPLGLSVRKRIGTHIIFRVRRGNGYFGAELNKRYQDKYKYTVPPSINNAQGETARQKLKEAVYNWKNTLTLEQKAAYNRRANSHYHMSGYNLYIREYILGEAS